MHGRFLGLVREAVYQLLSGRKLPRTDDFGSFVRGSVLLLWASALLISARLAEKTSMPRSLASGVV